MNVACAYIYYIVVLFYESTQLRNYNEYIVGVAATPVHHKLAPAAR